MIIGVGIDVVDLARFAATLERVPRLAERLFTPAERALPVRSLAGRFAVKEAMAKALGSPGGMSWQDVSVLRGLHGKPELVIEGSVARLADELGITNWHVSISHDGPVAVAYVIAERLGPSA